VGLWKQARGGGQDDIKGATEKCQFLIGVIIL
jgi:hypothetical protein